MPSELRCKNCTCSDYYNNNLVCWLYSDDEIYYLEEESEACPYYDERREVKTEWTNNDALSAEQKTQPNDSNTLNALDCISRQAAIDAPCHVDEYNGRSVEAIRNLPSAQPERKRGRWEIYVISMFDGEGCRCSECGFEGAPYWDYCPDCGADMREGSNNERTD